MAPEKGQPSGSISRALATNAAASIRPVRQSLPPVSSMSSPPSGSPRPPRATSTARNPATTTSRLPMTIGTVPGPTGPRAIRLSGRSSAETIDQDAERPEEQGHPTRSGPAPGCCRGRQNSRQPQLAQHGLRRGRSPLRGRSLNSSPLRKASVQPWSSRVWLHASLSCISVTASIHCCVSSSERPGGATMPRQLEKTRSTPSSVRVGASTPSTGLLAGDGEDADVAGLGRLGHLADAGGPELRRRRRGSRRAARRRRRRPRS